MDIVPLSDNENPTSYGIARQLNDPTKYNSLRQDRSVRPPSRIGVTMSTASHVLIIGFTVYICFVSFYYDYKLISWHPVCMTVGSLLLMAEAVMAMSTDNIMADKLGHHGRVRVHWFLQACAAGFIFAGFVVIIVNKNLNNKSHFYTWHGILGLVSVVLVGVTSSGGLVTLYAVRLKGVTKPAQMKLLHNLFGIATFVMGVVSTVFGLYSNWFARTGGYSAQVGCTVVVAMGGVLTLESAVKSACNRFKSIYRGS